MDRSNLSVVKAVTIGGSNGIADLLIVIRKIRHNLTEPVSS